MIGTYVFSTLALLSYNKICFGLMIIGLALRLGRGTRRLSLPRNLPCTGAVRPRSPGPARGVGARLARRPAGSLQVLGWGRDRYRIDSSRLKDRIEKLAPSVANRCFH